MRNFKNYVSYIPKWFMAVAVVSMVGGPLSVAMSTPQSAMAQEEPVEVESTVQVANVTAGDTEYKDNVDAKVDQVVKVQLWYHNREEADSGKVAENLKAKIGIPDQQGKQQTISSRVSADNSNTAEDTAQVNLSLENAYLDYVEGSADWRHNEGAKDGREECQTGDEAVPADDPNGCYTTEDISDDITKKDTGMVLEDARPCFAYESTVTVLAKVRASEVKVNKHVSQADEDTNPENNDWKVENEASPGDKLEYRIRFENKGNTVLEDVTVGDNLPDYMEYQEGSTYIYNGNNPDGVKAETDNVYQGGIRVGDYNPGAAGYVVFTVKVNPMTAFEQCGTYTLKNVGVVRPAGMNEFYNTAHTDVDVECEKPEPEEKFAKCVDLDASKTKIKPSTEVEFTAELETQNLDAQGYKIDFGDGSSAQTDGPTTSHVYEEAGEYEARVTHVVTNEGLKEVTGDDCVVTMKVKKKDQPEEEPKEKDEEPEELANTGIGSTLAGIFGSGALGASIRSWIRSRRNFLSSMLGE